MGASAGVAPTKKKKRQWIMWAICIWLASGLLGAAITMALIQRHKARDSSWTGLGGVYHQVSQQEIEKYNMVKESGSPMDKCVQAQMVAAATLQAQEPRYGLWKDIEREDCLAAGLRE